MCTLYVNSTYRVCELKGDIWCYRSAVNPSKLEACLCRPPFFQAKTGTTKAIPAVPMAPALEIERLTMMLSKSSKLAKEYFRVLSSYLQRYVLER